MEKVYAHQTLKQFVNQVFLKIGCPAEQAEKAAEVLITADLRGVDSHGVARSPAGCCISSDGEAVIGSLPHALMVK